MIVFQAAALMGLPKPGEGYTSGERFSDDVLKIELCGPTRSHFSVVDVPGLFQSISPCFILLIYLDCLDC